MAGKEEQENVNTKQQFVAVVNKLRAENPIRKTANLSIVLRDFIESRRCICGSGMFEGIAEATLYSEKVVENQHRQLEKYGTVPPPFIDFLSIFGIRIGRDEYLRKAMSEGHLAWRLMTRQYRFGSEKAKSTAEFLGKMILLSKHPELSRSFRVTQDMEKAMYLFIKDRI